MSNTNLEKFFSSGNIDIISDYEGEEINSKLYNNNNKLLICGDILDSTVGKGFEDYFIKTKGEINGIQKIYNLRNILTIVNNKNIHLIFGNRDVNKFKCKFLTKMNYIKDLDIFYKFNKGDINLHHNTYIKILDYIVETKRKNTQWTPWVADTKHWYPFWNNNINKYIDYWRKSESDIDNYIFLIRFYRIFGLDGSEGTMSAGNLLYTIPLELGITLDTAQITDKKYLDYLAFIVLAVFRTLTIYNKKPLDDNKLDKTINNIGTNLLLKDTILNGLLSKFYSGLINTSFVSYLNDTENNVLYIFSHGGITSKLITEFKVFNVLNPLIKHLNENKQQLTMSGGNMLSSEEIIEKLETINKEYINNLILSFRKPQPANYNPNKYNYKPTIHMLLTLATSASYKPNNDDMFVLNSSITPGIDEIQNHLFYCSDSNIVQIFGHIPKGFATNISKHIYGKYKTYLINLDYSQSYKFTNIGGKTICSLFFEKNNIKNGPQINSTIDLSELISKNLIVTNIKDLIPTETNTNKFYTNQKINGSVLNLSRNLFDKELLDYDDYIPEIPDYKYHGLFTDDKNQEFYVFTILSQHHKILVIKRKINKQQSAKEKYYKYKMKYLNLKMSLNNQI